MRMAAKRKPVEEMEIEENWSSFCVYLLQETSYSLQQMILININIQTNTLQDYRKTGIWHTRL